MDFQVSPWQMQQHKGAGWWQTEGVEVLAQKEKGPIKSQSFSWEVRRVACPSQPLPLPGTWSALNQRRRRSTFHAHAMSIIHALLPAMPCRSFILLFPTTRYITKKVARKEQNMACPPSARSPSAFQCCVLFYPRPTCHPPSHCHPVLGENDRSLRRLNTHHLRAATKRRRKRIWMMSSMLPHRHAPSHAGLSSIPTKTRKVDKMN